MIGVLAIAAIARLVPYQGRPPQACAKRTRGIPATQVWFALPNLYLALLALAVVQSAFNIANSIGAYLGGLVITGGLGLVAPNCVGASLAILGLCIAVVSGLLDRRNTVP